VTANETVAVFIMFANPRFPYQSPPHNQASNRQLHKIINNSSNGSRESAIINELGSKRSSLGALSLGEMEKREPHRNKHMRFQHVMSFPHAWLSGAAESGPEFRKR